VTTQHGVGRVRAVAFATIVPLYLGHFPHLIEVENGNPAVEAPTLFAP
jgi:hypothetical protein